MMQAQDEEAAHHRPSHPHASGGKTAKDRDHGRPPQNGHSPSSESSVRSASSSESQSSQSAKRSRRSRRRSKRRGRFFDAAGRRTALLRYGLPLWIFVLLHVVLDISPSSYLHVPRSFLGSLPSSSSEWSHPAAAPVGRDARVSSADAVAAAALSPVPAEIARRVDERPYDLLRDVSDLPVNLDQDLPYFWHIHKSGGSTMKHVLYCLGRAQTRRIEEGGCSDSEPDVRVCRRDFGTGMEVSVVNADASSLPGIQRAINLKLSERVFPEITDSKAFVVDTSRVFEAMPIFSPYRRGRLFVLFRHPVERAVSKYHYIKIATWERNYKPEVANMTMMEYAQSKHCYNDWMTRRLVHKMQDDLTPDDLNLAKEVLRRKALVLFTDDMVGAAERVRQYFHWSDEALGLDAEHKNCLQTHVHTQPMNANPHPMLDSNTPEWAAIREKNLFDIELVSYARELYVQQGEMIRRTLRGGTYAVLPPEPLAKVAGGADGNAVAPAMQ